MPQVFRCVAAFLGRFAALAVLAAPVMAGPLDGTRTAYLKSADGSRIAVARITFEQQGGGYELTRIAAPFSDHFLSMRPFRCIAGAQKHWCHVDYPYAHRRQVTEADLVDLEYDFLFIWKNAGDYGINMWNGVYYRLEVDGDRLVGRLHEMDMDELSAPPPEGEMRPVKDHHLEPGEPDSHWLPVLIIE